MRLQRTTVDKVIDDLERTWHLIEHDMSTEMQSALGILKEVMGYYYEEPCIAAWDNSNLIGVAVYGTINDMDKGIKDTHIKELASFSHEFGVGKALVEEVIKIGREERSDIVSLSHAPGVRSFYEKLGFVQNTYYTYDPALMMYRLESSANPSGTCYEDAWRFLIQQGEGFLIHGSMQLSEGGARVSHAWVETAYGWAWEPQTGQWFRIEDFNKMFAPIEDARYSAEDAAVMLARVGKHGPWSTEERENILGG